MKKVFLAIAIMGIILCGCGQTREESVKTESSETQKKEGVRIQSCEFPVDINTELYIDSVYLQEKLQVNGNVKITYEIIKEEGPDHDKSFEAEVCLNGKVLATGTGKSKKEAEMQAAKKVLES